MKTESNKQSLKKRIRRTPWGSYLLLAVVLWACIILGIIVGLCMAEDADATAPTGQGIPERPEVYVEELEIIEKPGYTEEELEILALIVYQEAGGDACSDETRLMVGTVVLNRVADDRYPNTIKEVALQRAQYGRLYWTGLVWPERAELPQEAHAVARAYEIAERLLEGERALPEDVIFQAEFVQGTEVVAERDGLYFCR